MIYAKRNTIIVATTQFVEIDIKQTTPPPRINVGIGVTGLKHIEVCSINKMIWLAEFKLQMQLFRLKN